MIVIIGFGIRSFKIGDILPGVFVKATVEAVDVVPESFYRFFAFFFRMACRPAVLFVANKASFLSLPGVVVSIVLRVVASVVTLIWSIILSVVSTVCEHDIRREGGAGRVGTVKVLVG